MHPTTKYLSLCALLAALLVLSPARVPAVAQSGPVLQNPNFDQGFSVRESAEVEVAVGWDYSYLSGDDRWCRSPCFRPEFKPESQIAISSTSQRWFTTFARQYAAIHQRVAVEAGQWYKFSCQVYAISEPEGQMAARVGANPWGAGPFDHTMVWGQQQPWAQYRQWHEVSVTFQAWSDRVRVAVGGVNAYPTKNNALYVENCRIESVDLGGECPECPDCPTPTPCPECPPGGEFDYDLLRAIVREELAGRSPVRWP